MDAACRAHYRDKHLTELREDTQTRTVGLFEGDTLIATMKLILFSMNFFGRMQPACGLMALEVHPLHKKEGAALYMVRYFEDYARRHGALLTLLLPFRISFYRRMGYGFAGKLYEYRPKIATGSEEMRQFIEMCFDPQSPMSKKLKQTLLQMMEVDK